MTVLSSETRLIGTGAAALPRVNLLPPEIAEKAQFRKVQIALGAVAIGAVGVVGVLYVGANSSLASANEQLATETATATQLQAEAAKYKNVTAIYAAADAAQAQLTTAMGDEIRYSQLLNDLSLTVPSNVWLKSLSFTQNTGAPAAGATAAAGAVTTPGAAASLGTLTVSGVGFEHNDVAVWLESIAGLKTYDSPYFSNSTEVLLGTKPTVTFTSTAGITSKALSGRYTKPVGG